MEDDRGFSGVSGKILKILSGVHEMRLFIAINLNEDTKARLVSLRDELRSRSARGRFVLPENLHLTLAFLGECDDKKAAAARQCMEGMEVQPVSLVVDRVGRFPRRAGDIWWAGLQGNEGLLDLQRILTNSLISAGFSLDARKYSPHITLGRQVVTGASPWRIQAFGETARVIDLMRSERIRGRLTYTSIFRRGQWENPITIEPYDPRWVDEFRRIREFLRPHLGGLALDIHHVGSTGVPGLAAKPIIDLDIEIRSMADFPALLRCLEKLGYSHKGDYGIGGREVVKRDRTDEFMKCHMYVCPSCSPELKRHLVFRDYLRSNPEAAREYGDLKHRLAAEHGCDIDAYIKGKTKFIEKVLSACYHM